MAGQGLHPTGNISSWKYFHWPEMFPARNISSWKDFQPHIYIYIYISSQRYIWPEVFLAGLEIFSAGSLSSQKHFRLEISLARNIPSWKYFPQELLLARNTSSPKYFWAEVSLAARKYSWSEIFPTRFRQYFDSICLSQTFFRHYSTLNIDQEQSHDSRGTAF